MTGGLAPTGDALTAARVLQGVCAALITSSAPALPAMSFPETRERRRTYGTYLALAGSDPALGLPAGGFLPPVHGLAVLPVRRPPLRPDRPDRVTVLVQDRPNGAPTRSDGRGLLLASVGGAGISGAVPHFRGASLIVSGAAALLLVVFVWWETRQAEDLAVPSGSGPQAPVAALPVLAVVNVGVAAVLSSMDCPWAVRLREDARERSGGRPNFGMDLTSESR